MKTAELKTKIRNYLESVEEATAKQITKAVNHEKYPSEVISALGEMRTDAEIEYEKKKGKGNEYWYWLIKAANTEPVAPTDKECCNAARVVAATAGAEVTTLRKQIATTFETMRGRVEELESEIEAARQIIASMEIETQQHNDGDAKHFANAAVGYIVRAPKRRPRVIISPDRAREADLSAARQHGRGDVLALVPVGKAVRGAEWREAK